MRHWPLTGFTRLSVLYSVLLSAAYTANLAKVCQALLFARAREGCLTHAPDVSKEKLVFTLDFLYPVDEAGDLKWRE